MLFVLVCSIVLYIPPFETFIIAFRSSEEWLLGFGFELGIWCPLILLMYIRPGLGPVIDGLQCIASSSLSVYHATPRTRTFRNRSPKIITHTAANREHLLENDSCLIVISCIRSTIHNDAIPHGIYAQDGPIRRKKEKVKIKSSCLVDHRRPQPGRLVQTEDPPHRLGKYPHTTRQKFQYPRWHRHGLCPSC